MPYIYTDDDYITPEMFVKKCSDTDLRVTANLLFDEGYTHMNIPGTRGLGALEFIRDMESINLAYYQLTPEEQEIIRKLGKKYRGF